MTSSSHVFPSPAEIDTLFNSSYLSYVTHMNSSNLNKAWSVFTAASAKRSTNKKNSNGRKKRRRKEKEKEKKRKVLEELIAKRRKKPRLTDYMDVSEEEEVSEPLVSKDEAYLFYALPDKRLSKRTNKFVKQYNKDKSLLNTLPTIDDINGVDNVIHKHGDLPCERYFAIICRKFEKIIYTNDKDARLKSVEGRAFRGQEASALNMKYRSAYVAKITEAGKEFVEDMMKILFNYRRNIDLNRLEDSQFNADMLSDENIGKNFDFSKIKEIQDFYSTTKETEQGFLGLSQRTLKLYDEMKRQNLTKKFYKIFEQEERETERKLRLFTYDSTKNRILTNVIGAIPLVDIKQSLLEIQDKPFYEKRNSVGLPDTLSSVKKKLGSFINQDDDKTRLFELFVVDKKKLDDNKIADGIFSMDRLFYLLYQYYSIETSSELDSMDNSKFKEEFVNCVNSYKELERRKVFSTIQQTLMLNADNFDDDPLRDYLESLKLQGYLMLFQSSKTDNFDAFKLVFEIDKHLSRNIRLQYYKETGLFKLIGKVGVGEIEIEGYPEIECIRSLNIFFKKLNDDLKVFWKLLYDNLGEESRNGPDIDTCKQYGIVFPESDNFDIDDSDFGFLKMYLGQSKVMEAQKWKDINDFLSDETYEDFFENNMEEGNILKYMFDSVTDYQGGRRLKSKAKKRKVNIHMFVEMYQNVSAYDFNRQIDETTTGENLWDHFYNKFEGLFYKYKRYSNSLENMSKDIKTIGETDEDIDVTTEQTSIRLNNAIAVQLSEKILNTEFEALKNVKIIEEEDLFKVLQYMYGYKREEKQFKIPTEEAQIELEEDFEVTQYGSENDFFSTYTNVVFPLRSETLEDTGLDSSKPLIINLTKNFEEASVFKKSNEKKNAEEEKNIKIIVDLKVKDMQQDLDLRYRSDFENSYQDQLKKNLYIWDFDRDKSRSFYVKIKQKTIKNPKQVISDRDSYDSKNSPNMSFIDYLKECLSVANTSQNNILPNEFKRLKEINDSVDEQNEVFPMFFNKYFDKDFRTSENVYNPNKKKYMRNRFLFFNNSRTESAIEKEAKTYVEGLKTEINSKGELYVNSGESDEKIKLELQQLTRDLNVMLTLYNFNDATAARVSTLLFYIVATSFSYAGDLESDTLADDENNWGKSTKLNAAALLKLFCNKTNYNDIFEMDNGLRTLIKCWYNDRQDTEKNKIDFQRNELQQAIEGKNLFGLIPIKKFEEHATVSDIVTGTDGKIFTTLGTENLPIDYEFSVGSLIDDVSGVFKIKKTKLNNKQKPLIDILLDSKVQLQLCAYKHIVDAMNSDLDDLLKENNEEVQKRRIKNNLGPKAILNKLVDELNLESKRVDQLPKEYNMDLQTFRFDNNADDPPKGLLFYEAGDLVIYEKEVYEYLFSDEIDGKIQEKELLKPDDADAGAVWRKITTKPLSKDELTALMFYRQTREENDSNLSTTKIKKMSQKNMMLQDQDGNDKGKYDFIKDTYALSMMRRRMNDIMPRRAEKLKFVVTSLNEKYSLTKNEDAVKIVDHLNSCLKDLYMMLPQDDDSDDFNITSWFSRRKNVFTDPIPSREDVPYTDLELLYGTQRDVWENVSDIDNQSDVKGILNYSYKENINGFEQDADKYLFEIEDVDDETMYNSLRSREDEETYLFKDLENIADWIHKGGGQEKVFYSRNYVEQIKTYLKDFLVLMQDTTDKYTSITQEARLTNNLAYTKKSIDDINTYCRKKENEPNTTINKKLQVYCDFHSHLSKIVFGLKLQVLKLYNEGICETTEYDNDALNGTQRYNILFNQLSANLKKNIKPRQIYLEYLKQDGSNNPNNEDNSHIERRRETYRRLIKKEDGISIDIEKYFIKNSANLPEWFYNRLLDTYVVFNKDLRTIVSNVKVPFKFQGFDFALLLEDALQSSAKEVFEFYGDSDRRYKETAWNDRNQNITKEYTDEERDSDLVKGLENFTLSKMEKGQTSQKEVTYSMVRDYMLDVYLDNSNKYKVDVIRLNNNCCLLGIDEFVKEVNHHLFLEDLKSDGQEGQFLKKYLWNIFKFECQKYEHREMLNQIKFTKDYISKDGYDKDVVVYKKVNKNKVAYDNKLHGEIVASYIYPKKGYIKEQRKSTKIDVVDTSFKRYFFLTSKGNLFYKKKEKKRPDSDAFEIYKSPTLVINTLTKKFDEIKEETFHILSTDEAGNSKWVPCEDVASTCVFHEKNKDKNNMSSFYHGIDGILVLLKKYIEQYAGLQEEKVIKKDNKEKTVASYFVGSLQQIQRVLKNLKKWFSSGNKESSRLEFNKFHIITPTVNYMKFFKDMHYKYKSMKRRLELKYSAKKKIKLRKSDLLNSYISYLLESYNDEFNVYKDMLQRLEYSIMARYSINKEKRGENNVNTYNDASKKAFIKNISSSMLLDSLLQRNSIGDKLIQRTFFSVANDKFATYEINKDVMEVSNIVNFEDACLNAILKNIKNSQKEEVNAIKMISRFDVASVLKTKSQNNNINSFANYTNDVKDLIKNLITNLLEKGKEDSSLEKFKVDLYTLKKTNRGKFKNELRRLYLKNYLNRRNVNIKINSDNTTKEFKGEDVAIKKDRVIVKSGKKEKQMYPIENVVISPSELQKFSKEYINQDILVKKFKHDDILLADVDYENPNKQLLTDYERYIKSIKIPQTDGGKSMKYEKLTELFHLFCGIENKSGKLEVYGILYYIQLLYKLVLRERQTICEIHEGCKCVVINRNGEKDNKYSDIYYTVEEIKRIDLEVNRKTEESQVCSLRGKDGELLKNKYDQIDFVEIDFLVNINKTTSAPFTTVVVVRENYQDTLHASSYRYISKFINGMPNNSINVNGLQQKIKDSDLISPDNFILLAENQVGRYNGSDLDIFYNIKLMAMEKQLDNLLSVLVSKLNDIEDFLLNNDAIPKITGGQKREKLLYRSLLKAVEDEQELIKFWKADIVKYDERQMLSDGSLNVRQIQEYLTKDNKRKVKLNDKAMTKLKSIESHYRENQKALQYKEAKTLQLKDTKKEKQNKQKKTKENNISGMEVLRLPSPPPVETAKTTTTERTTKVFPSETTDTSNKEDNTVSVLSKMIKLMI